jgi:hypothetical protein
MSMTRRVAFIAPIAFAALPLACEDSGVAESRQAQAQLAAARAAYLEVMANRPSLQMPADAPPAGLDDEETRQIDAYLALRSKADRALSGIANQISPLATNGNAAAGLMLAEVKLEQAWLRKQDLLAAASTASTARRATLALARAAAEFESARTGVELPIASQEDQDSPFRPSEDLQSVARDAAQQARSSQANVEILQSELQILLGDIESFRRGADELNADATGLQREASSLNPIDAYEPISEAADLRRLANAMTREAANQEINLDEKEAEILVPQRQRLRLAAAAAGLERRANLIEELRGLLTTQSDDFRVAAEAVLEKLVPRVADIQLGDESDFGQAAAAARSDFQAAADAVRRASSSGGRQLQSSLDWTLVSAKQGEAAVWVIEADSLASQASFLKALLENVPAAPQADRWRRALDKASADSASARASADEVFTELLDSLDSMPEMSGESGTLIQQEIRSAMASFAQRAVGTESSFGRGPDSGSGSATASADGPPFTSPEALLAFLQQGGIADGNPTMFDQVFAATSPAGRRALKTVAALGEVAESARAASVERFGQPVSPIAMVMSRLTPEFEGATISSDDGSAATVVTSLGQLGLLNQDGAWVVDFDGLQAVVPQLVKFSQMSEATVPTMGPRFAMFAQRIRDGEFASAEEAGGAMQQEMMAAMMGAAGGSR